MASSIRLQWHDYKYFPYEKELALWELNGICKLEGVEHHESGVDAVGKFDKTILERLVYFQSYQFNGKSCETLQSLLERGCSSRERTKKQVTRYSAHGLHEYKGKFNPQIVRGILNGLGVSHGATILDPFCGSGTTLLECAHADINAVGTDLNPLAVFLSNAKVMALSVPAQGIHKAFKRCKEVALRWSRRRKTIRAMTSREQYLSSWFPMEYLLIFEGLREAYKEQPAKIHHILLALTSDILRDYSWQEPVDLRIRRRSSPFPDDELIVALENRVERFVSALYSMQQSIGPVQSNNKAYKLDIRKTQGAPWRWKNKPEYDAAITSPPYATALPYIDTQRLSLVWIGLAEPKQLGLTESALIGSREVGVRLKKEWATSLRSNTCGLPCDSASFCNELLSKLSVDDGFRRQAVPLLLYRYLVSMRDMFGNVKSLLKPGAPFALVVGHNRTTLGGNAIDINTPNLLLDLAVNNGWRHVESKLLQAYPRYGLHQKNAVKAETLIVIENGK